MDIIKNVTCGSAPPEVATCSTGVRYSYNIEQKERKNDIEGEDDEIYWMCDQYWFPGGEYQMVQNGTIPSSMVTYDQEPQLHAIFRTAQHNRSITLQAMADRKIREGDEKWEAYRKALDEWNNEVSALKATFSTIVPPLPKTP